MRDHEYFQQLMDRMLDEELSPAEETALREHVRTCPDCKVLMDALLTVRVVLAEDMAEPPAALAQGVMDRIRAENDSAAPAPIPIRKAKKRRAWQRWAVAACLAVVVGSGAWMALDSGLFRMDRRTQPLSDTIPAPAVAAAGEETAENAAVSGAAERSADVADAPAPREEEAAAPADREAPLPAAPAEQEDALQQAPAPEAIPEAASITEDFPVHEAAEDRAAEAEATAQPDLPPPPMPEEAMPGGDTAGESFVTVDTPSAARMLALPVYGPDGEPLGAVTDLDALDGLLAENDPIPGNLSEMEWDVICTLELDGTVYTFASGEDGERLVWWTDADPVINLSPGTPDDLLGLIQ